MSLEMNFVPFENASNATDVRFDTRCEFFDRPTDSQDHESYLTNESVAAGQWSTRGCFPASSSPGSVTCVCDHLTEFRAITEVSPYFVR